MTTSRDKWDAIVVGAGLGGLSCAAVLSKSGLKVLVLERHNKVGGYAHQFVRKAGPDIEYRFTVSRYMTASLRELVLDHTTNEKIGAVFSYSTTPTGHTRFRPRLETPVPGLYLASTWTTSGPGFGPAVAGGTTTARKILKKTQVVEAVQPAR